MATDFLPDDAGVDGKLPQNRRGSSRSSKSDDLGQLWARVESIFAQTFDSQQRRKLDEHQILRQHFEATFTQLCNNIAAVMPRRDETTDC